MIEGIDYNTLPVKREDKQAYQREYMKQYYQTENGKASKQKYVEANREKIAEVNREASKRIYEKKKEERKAQMREYYYRRKAMLCTTPTLVYALLA